MVLGGARWHFRRLIHAPHRTQRHSLAIISKLVARFARRRSGVRLPCGPPLICREIVRYEPSARPPESAAATILQPKSVRTDGDGWGSLGLDGTNRTTIAPGGYATLIRES